MPELTAEGAVKEIREILRNADTSAHYDECAFEWYIINPINGTQFWGQTPRIAENQYSDWLGTMSDGIRRNPANAIDLVSEAYDRAAKPDNRSSQAVG